MLSKEAYDYIVAMLDNRMTVLNELIDDESDDALIDMWQAEVTEVEQAIGELYYAN